MLTIEKNIPQPKITRGRKSKYPFSKMQIGDSFFIPTTEQKRIRNTVFSSAYSWSKRNLPGFKLTTQIQPSGLRLWRIK